MGKISVFFSNFIISQTPHVFMLLRTSEYSKTGVLYVNRNLPFNIKGTVGVSRDNPGWFHSVQVISLKSGNDKNVHN